VRRKSVQSFRRDAAANHAQCAYYNQSVEWDSPAENITDQPLNLLNSIFVDPLPLAPRKHCRCVHVSCYTLEDGGVDACPFCLAPEFRRPRAKLLSALEQGDQAGRGHAVARRVVAQASLQLGLGARAEHGRGRSRLCAVGAHVVVDLDWPELVEVPHELGVLRIRFDR
jgi:hypothetical protein